MAFIFFFFLAVCHATCTTTLITDSLFRSSMCFANGIAGIVFSNWGFTSSGPCDMTMQYYDGKVGFGCNGRYVSVTGLAKLCSHFHFSEKFYPLVLSDLSFAPDLGTIEDIAKRYDVTQYVTNALPYSSLRIENGALVIAAPNHNTDGEFQPLGNVSFPTPVSFPNLPLQQGK